jgi:hypothetical protein
MKRICRIMLTVIVAAALCFASGSDTTPTLSNQQFMTGTKAIIADSIFNDIMVNLPVDVKAQVDSMQNIKKSDTSRIKKRGDLKRIAADTLKTDSIKTPDGLPEEVRRQVERTIRDMETQKKKREMEFKESKQNGGQRGRP